MKPNLTEEEFINWWLEKYHNTNLEEVIQKHPEWKNEDHSRDFYTTYAVTQEQHDEWYEWAIQRIMKHYRYGKKMAQKQFAFPYLNVSPTVK
jgi:hypothetical protein